MPNLFDLSGKVALVTGGAQGLGAAMARGLVQHGAATTIVDVRAEVAADSAHGIAAECDGGELHAEACDVRDRQQVRRCVEGLLSRFGRIDVLINNAGIHRRVATDEFSQQDVDDVIGVNLLGSFYVAGEVGKTMIEQGAGSIINISALGGGLMGLGRGGSIYGMTKGGLVALTRDLAAEWGRYGVRVNAIAPGWMRTPLTHALQNDPEKSARVIERVPLSRWGEADDMAGVAVFLASDASTYITGHTIPVDGGAANVISLSE